MIKLNPNGDRSSVDTYLGIDRPKPKPKQSVRAIGDDREFLNMLLGAQPSASGVPVNHRNSLRFSPVWCAVQTISGDVSKLPLDMFERGRNDPRARFRATGESAYTLVRRAANPFMSAFRFWRRLMVHVLLWNRAYAIIERDGAGIPIALWPLLPDRCQLFPDRSAPFYRAEIGGELVSIDYADVFDLQGITLEDDHPELTDLVRQARDTWSVGIAAKGFGAKFFANGLHASGIFTIPPEMTQEAADNLMEDVRLNVAGLDNAFKATVLEDGVKFHQTMIDPEKSQMNETNQESVLDVARYYSIPPHKLMHDSNVSYSSLEQENQSYLDSCLSPWLTEISSQCFMKLLTERQKAERRYFFEHNTTALLRTDSKTQVEVGKMGVEAGFWNANEFRATQNLNPREGGDQYYYSNNMQPEGVDPVSGEGSSE